MVGSFSPWRNIIMLLLDLITPLVIRLWGRSDGLVSFVSSTSLLHVRVTFEMFLEKVKYYFNIRLFLCCCLCVFIFSSLFSPRTSSFPPAQVQTVIADCCLAIAVSPITFFIRHYVTHFWHHISVFNRDLMFVFLV